MKYAAIVAGLMLVLSGCGTEDKADPGNVRESNISTVKEVHVNLEDGRVVTCLIYGIGNKGGLSCDWSRAE